MIRHEVEDDVHVLVMTEPAQVLNATSVRAIHAALDVIEDIDGPAAMVLVGEGRTFSQGLDLPWVIGLGDGMGAFLRDVHGLFGRLLRLPVPTVAAVNGHAIAGGAMLAQCLDLRIMRADRGWVRLPEVELDLPFTPVMDALLAARLPQPVQHRLMVLGQRLDGREAAAAGVVDECVEGVAEVLSAATERARDLARFAGPVIGQIRATRYAGVLGLVDAEAPDAGS